METQLLGERQNQEQPKDGLELLHFELSLLKWEIAELRKISDLQAAILEKVWQIVFPIDIISKREEIKMQQEEAKLQIAQLKEFVRKSVNSTVISN